MALLDELRRRHFPPERNHLAAHLTLFHHLPGEQLARVREDLADVARRSAPAAKLDRVLRLGRGVAFGVDSAGLLALRRELADRWAPWLTAQDRGWGRPHVTVQNKVAPELAAALHARLAARHVARPTRVEALRLWRYEGGPWTPLDRYPLRGGPSG